MDDCSGISDEEDYDVNETDKNYNFLFCDCCPCRYEKKTHITGYSTSGYDGNLVSIAIEQNGNVHRYEKTKYEDSSK